MNDLKRKTMYLLIEHKKVFNQNPAKQDLMDHVKLLQDRVDTLEKKLMEVEIHDNYYV